MGLFSWLFGGGDTTYVTQETVQKTDQNINVGVSPKITTNTDVDLFFDFDEVAKALESYQLSNEQIAQASILSNFLVTSAQSQFDRETEISAAVIQGEYNQDLFQKIKTFAKPLIIILIVTLLVKK